MYPLIFHPIYKEMIWGGDGLKERFGRTLPSDKTGESWDISCRDDGMGIVKNGELAGKTFRDAIETDRKGMLGTKLYEVKDFPLFVKLIDAKDDLSVQVHPDDAYARAAEGYVFGKNELWYILDAPEDASIIVGLLEGVSKDAFKKALENDDVERLLSRLPIKKGDIINIQAGLIHALTKGVMVAEIQQNSNITYRVYDYNRRGTDGSPRELHVNKALDVIDFEGKIHKGTVKGLSTEKDGNAITYYIANKYFAVEKIDVKKQLSANADGEKFYIYTCVEGECAVVSGGGSAALFCGDSVLIPAALGEYGIKGACTLLKSYVPDIKTDFLAPLTAAGFTEDEIKTNVSIEQ